MKTSGGKLRILHIYDILRTKSSDEHPLTTPEILDELERRGVSAERKAVYGDIEALREFGYPIEQLRGRDAGYYLRSQGFELSELKLLVDAVQSSKFITAKRSRELISKLTDLADATDSGALRRQVYVASRVKSESEAALAAVDTIHAAIAGGRKIAFDYTRWAVDFGGAEPFVKEQRGERRTASPVALAWDDENYYLVAYFGEGCERRNFRVDKMERVEILGEKRDERGEYLGFDGGDYSKKMFGMFHGERRQVKLRFRRDFANAAVDRLGREVHISPDGDEHFLLSCEVVVSPQFFSWLIGLEGGAELVEPADARAQMRKLLADALKMYNE